MTRLPRLLLAAYLLLLAIAVLTPTPPPHPPDPLAPEAPIVGLVSDLVRNLVLMLPLGWLLAASGISLARTFVAGLALSIAIELAQRAIPGRHSTLSDVVANSASAAAGAVLYASRFAWGTPVGPNARRLAIGSFAAACAVLGLGVQALRPSLRGSEFFAGLRPELGQYETYAGRVESARIGTMPLAPGPIADDEAFIAALGAEEPIVLEATLRSSRRDPAALLTIHDAEQEELFVLAVDGDDLVVGMRLVTADLGLDAPVHRWSDAVPDARGSGPAPSPSQPPLAEIRLERSPGSVELWIDGRSLGLRRWRPGDVGALLLSGRVLPGWAADGLAVATIALLALPCAYYARSVVLPPFGLGTLMLVLPYVGPVSPPTRFDWIGLAIGLAAARVARALVLRRLARSKPSDLSRATLWC